MKTNFARYVNADNANTANANDPQRRSASPTRAPGRDLNGDFTIYNPDGSVQLNELGTDHQREFRQGRFPTTTTQDPTTLNGFGSARTRPWNSRRSCSISSRRASRSTAATTSAGSATSWPPTTRWSTAADFDGPFCITAPPSPQLPGGGGYPVCGLYDIKAGASPLVQNNITFASNFGGITDHYMGFDIGMNARFGHGGFVQGGINAQRRVYDTCNAPILSGTTTSARSTVRRRCSATR